MKFLSLILCLFALLAVSAAVPQDEVDVPELTTEQIDEPIELPIDLVEPPMDDPEMIEPVMAIEPTFLRRTVSKKTVAKKSCRKPVTKSECHRPTTTKKPAPKKTLKKHLDKAFQPQVRNC